MLAKETVRAVMFGLACGDTLGYQVEFINHDAIQRRFGPAGVQSFPPGSTFSDDTQMAVAVAEGILDSAAFAEQIAEGKDDETRRAAYATLVGVVEQVMPNIAKRFVEWAFGPKNDRAPGNTCMAGCRALRSGTNWMESGVTRSKGCGSMMRAAPVGLVYSDPRTVMEMAGAQGEITHGHKAATQAAQLTALAVHLLATKKVTSGHLTAEFLLSDVMEAFQTATGLTLKGYDPKLLKLLDRAAGALKMTLAGELKPQRAMLRYKAHDLALGESWEGDEAVASALYCFLLAHQRGEGYVEAVRYGANTTGDSDSIAAVSGAFAGAWWGLGGDKGVPLDWIEYVEDSAYLGDLADRLASLSSTLAT